MTQSGVITQKSHFLTASKECQNYCTYSVEKKFPAHPPEVAVQQPVQEGVPEAVAQRQPRGDEIQGRRRPRSRASRHHFLYGPGGDQHDETQRHGRHRPRGVRAEATFLCHQLLRKFQINGLLHYNIQFEGSNR